MEAFERKAAADWNSAAGWNTAADCNIGNNR